MSISCYKGSEKVLHFQNSEKESEKNEACVKAGYGFWESRQEHVRSGF